MEKKVVYPRMPKSVWVTLREQFLRKLPPQVTHTYLMDVLQCGKSNAQNLLPALRQLGLIDGDGKLMPRASDWRNDAKYDDVCRSMVEAIYPLELRELLAGPEIDPTECEQWFLHSGGLGQSSAGQAADTYILLNTPLAQLLQEAVKNGKPREPKGAADDKSKKVSPMIAPRNSASASLRAKPQNTGASVHTVHLDVHIHLPAEATPEQIEVMFSSLARHLQPVSTVA